MDVEFDSAVMLEEHLDRFVQRFAEADGRRDEDFLVRGAQRTRERQDQGQRKRSAPSGHRLRARFFLAPLAGLLPLDEPSSSIRYEAASIPP